MRSHRLRFALVGASLLVATACSLIVDTNADQCVSDADCAGFSAICQSGVCVSLAGTADGSILGPDGAPLGPDPDAACVRKTPTSQEDFLNETCTNAQCFPFDDCQRLGVCDAGVPSLVAPPDGGV